MQTLNKISKYAFLTTGLSLALSATPVNAQAFRIGETGTSPGTAVPNFAGQTFTLNIPGDFPPATTRPNALLNSIKFSLLGGTTANLSVTAFLFDISTSGIPTAADALAGIGRIGQSTSTTLIDPDSEFDNDTLRSLRFSSFTFTGSSELSTTREYGIFFSVIDAGNTVRVSSSSQYSGGIAYRNNGSTPLVPITGDSFFIVDATGVPFEFEASGGVAILGGLFLANKLRNRKQNDKADEQS